METYREIEEETLTKDGLRSIFTDPNFSVQEHITEIIKIFQWLQANEASLNALVDAYLDFLEDVFERETELKEFQKPAKRIYTGKEFIESRKHAIQIITRIRIAILVLERDHVLRAEESASQLQEDLEGTVEEWDSIEAIDDHTRTEYEETKAA